MKIINTITFIAVNLFSTNSFAGNLKPLDDVVRGEISPAIAQYVMQRCAAAYLFAESIARQSGDNSTAINVRQQAAHFASEALRVKGVKKISSKNNSSAIDRIYDTYIENGKSSRALTGNFIDALYESDFNFCNALLR